jgi:predicted phage-related endonuclease
MTITAEQKQFRHGKIGASDFATAIGLNPYNSAAWLYHKLRGEVSWDGETIATRAGTVMEPLIAEAYTEKTGRSCEEYGDTLIHPTEPRIICHCDYKTTGLDEDRLVEIKNVGPRMHGSWDDGPPDYVRVQACGQSMLDQTPGVDIAAYFGGNDVRVYELYFSPSDWEFLDNKLQEFLAYVDREEEPPLTKADLPFLSKYYVDNNTTAIATKDVEIAARRLREIKKNVKADDKEAADLIDGYTMQVQEFMKESSILLDNDGKPMYTWKATKPSSKIDWESVANETKEYLYSEPVAMFTDQVDAWFAGIVKKHTKTTPGSRKFICKIK